MGQTPCERNKRWETFAHTAAVAVAVAVAVVVAVAAAAAAAVVVVAILHLSSRLYGIQYSQWGRTNSKFTIGKNIFQGHRPKLRVPGYPGTRCLQYTYTADTLKGEQ